MKNIRPTKQQTLEALEEGWGAYEANYGYGFFTDDDGLVKIEKIDSMGVFDGDGEAVKQAKKDGIKFLKVPKKYGYYGNVVDLESNKRKLKKWGLLN